MNQPYQAPKADVSMTGVGNYQPKFLSLSGRIGRMRYFAYATGLTLMFYAVLGVLAAIMIPAFADSSMGVVIGLLFAVGAIVVLVFSWGYMVRRLNDINASGWLSLLMLVPLVNIVLGLVLLFKKGSEGENNYGAAPVANSGGVIAAFWIFLLLMVGYVGVVIPMAMTQYEGYLQRSEAMQMEYEQGYDY
ncbi:MULTISPECIES: DUF805 domain-containing protein [unclassified Alcanivorax]|jgi:uncharacterized membrane protein YhaH (DUF805 family)|uniref:DUF805 domain-containing protein n=1 Tax=unclassified Alcanivorax TaxID=2638842 RepID=UPI000789C59B|nr:MULTISPECIES: DUF805 domain-containing protein [unclassified Alcanivorax]MBU85221.1 DUF805 domain-containing protein [Alcanivorax sp.]MEE2602841.1 DUF805 domain-containing protein [Pseudomonadota bacterium]MEE3386672.1 DUF805 domain-containing protein [Pseudomonadota bacterium]SEF59538.1 Uncharacterized membrane protein YhaH, DUF805 family [Alcanivorax sp. DSM 26293]|tara:strand:- start:64 stop:633 length:570 start_codon:yes stop_codon:yes gene_type:complete